MEFRVLTLLAPLLFALHNLEEAPRMAAWAGTLPGPRWASKLTTPRFVLAVVLLTTTVTAVAVWSYLAPESVPARLLLLELQAAIGFNALVPHTALLLRLRRYNPGLVTALALELPFSVLFLGSAVTAGLVNGRTLAILLAVAPVVMALSALAALRVAIRILAAGG